MTSKQVIVNTLISIFIMLIVALICYYFSRDWLYSEVVYNSIIYDCNCSYPLGNNTISIKL